MQLDALQYLLGLFSGGLVGFSLGAFGGGGSILAVPLMVYIVGVPSAHLAIGTSAVAVAANALINAISHARLKNVRWRCAAIHGGAGILGAFLGSTVGKAMDGQALLALFTVLMLIVAVAMFRRRGRAGDPEADCGRANAPKVMSFGLGTGALSGFFGIGGGFLIVPALIAATGMATFAAVGTSLVAIAMFGLTTALNYAVSGYVDWPLAATFLAGGALGGALGTRTAQWLSRRKGLLDVCFAGVIALTAVYILARNLPGLV